MYIFFTRKQYFLDLDHRFIASLLCSINLWWWLADLEVPSSFCAARFHHSLTGRLHFVALRSLLLWLKHQYMSEVYGSIVPLIRLFGSFSFVAFVWVSSMSMVQPSSPWPFCSRCQLSTAKVPTTTKHLHLATSRSMARTTRLVLVGLSKLLLPSV